VAHASTRAVSARSGWAISRPAPLSHRGTRPRSRRACAVSRCPSANTSAQRLPAIASYSHARSSVVLGPAGGIACRGGRANTDLGPWYGTSMGFGFVHVWRLRHWRYLQQRRLGYVRASSSDLVVVKASRRARNAAAKTRGRTTRYTGFDHRRRRQPGTAPRSGTRDQHGHGAHHGSPTTATAKQD